MSPCPGAESAGWAGSAGLRDEQGDEINTCADQSERVEALVAIRVQIQRDLFRTKCCHFLSRACLPDAIDGVDLRPVASTMLPSV